MKSFLILMLISLGLYASSSPQSHKGLIKSQILNLKKEDKSFFITNLKDIEFKSNIQLTECMLNNTSDKETELFCLTSDSRSLFIEIKDIVLKGSFLIIQNPYIIGREVNVGKIVESFK